MESKKSKLKELVSTEESRRDFLKKAGKMAIYTPPAIMLLMHPSRHALACSVRPPKQGGYSGKGDWWGKGGGFKGGGFKDGGFKDGGFKDGGFKGGGFKGGGFKDGGFKGGSFKGGSFKGGSFKGRKS